MIETLVSVAGFDPSAGAGVLLDVAVFNRLGYHGSAVLTAVTAQNTRTVRDVQILPARFILKQWEILAADLPIAGVKFGMLGGAEGIKAMRAILERTEGIPRVIDPVFRSSSGYSLMSGDLIRRFLRTLRNRATLITPNIAEAEIISGMTIGDVAAMKTSALRISVLAGMPCLLKGGHLETEGFITDVLFNAGRLTVFRHRKIPKDVRGTGCFLSSAVVAHLARGLSLETACRRAVRLTGKALARPTAVGRGRLVFRDFSERAGVRR